MVGFYLLALGISAGLLWIPYAEYTYAGRLHVKILAVCVGAAGAILWALVPRVDRFTPPGPALTRAEVPQLFTIIDDVARATQQPAPSDVYLLNEVNAWVTHRGGVMGFGSRRVMGIGLPLMNHLSPQELGAVIAHEFGHYVGGDVSLGPWIYKTRAAIGRAIAGVHETIFEAPFRWYGRLFLKVTLAVSRNQEFVADAVAARIAGGQAMGRALERVAMLAPAYVSYLNTEIVPILRSGYVPPIAEGFKMFVCQPDVVDACARLVGEQTTGSDAGEFDTHPPLQDRLSALAHLQTSDQSLWHGTELALPDPDKHSRTLLGYVLGQEGVERLQPIAWNEVGPMVYVRSWDQMISHFAKWFGAMTPEQMPIGKPAFIRKGSDLVGPHEINVNSDERIRRAIHVLTAGLGSLLARNGWSIETLPGRPRQLLRDGQRFDPRAVIVQLSDGSLTAETWQRDCHALGISGLPLVQAQSQ